MAWWRRLPRRSRSSPSFTSAAAEALHSAEVKDKLAAQGAIAVGNSSAEFSAYVKSEIERWGKVIAAAGIKIK